MHIPPVSLLTLPHCPGIWHVRGISLVEEEGSHGTRSTSSFGLVGKPICSNASTGKGAQYRLTRARDVR